MDKAAYTNALSRIDVKQISFLEVSARLFPENLTEGKINVDSNNSVELSISASSHSISAIDSYVLNGLLGEQVVFEIKLRLMVIFALKEKPSDDFLKVFQDNTLKVITYPYVRQKVQNLTGDLGLPPLVLPMWRLPSESDKELLATASTKSNTKKRSKRSS